MSTLIVRMPAMQAMTGLPKSTLYLRMAQGIWPRPIKLGGSRAAGWPTVEIEAVLSAMIAGYDTADLQKLVQELAKARSAKRQV